MTPAQRAKAALEYVTTWQISTGGLAQYHLENNDAKSYDECRRVSDAYDTIREALEQMADEGTIRTEKPCRYYKAYKAIYKPKCNCQPCMDKWIAAQESSSEGGGE